MVWGRAGVLVSGSGWSGRETVHSGHVGGARRRRMMATKNTKHPLAASSPCVSNHLYMRPTQGEEARKEPRTFAPPVAPPSRPYGGC
ncbi:MAG: hypothetical protein OT477_13380 [Chloroflexi bacterium]|nr:hypothetical protein [Chloroflexota bacterium]